jgi:hypothetical protein
MTVLLSDVITGSDGASLQNGQDGAHRASGAHAAQFRLTGLTRLLRPRAARGRHVLTAAECRQQQFGPSVTGPAAVGRQTARI